MARAGQKIKLECEISGLPPPTLTWTHNGKPLKEARETKVSKHLSVFLAQFTNFSLEIYLLIMECNIACKITITTRAV